MRQRHYYLLEFRRYYGKIVDITVVRFDSVGQRHRYIEVHKNGEVRIVGSTNRYVVEAIRLSKLGYEWPICVYGELDGENTEVQRESVESRQ